MFFQKKGGEKMTLSLLFSAIVSGITGVVISKIISDINIADEWGLVIGLTTTLILFMLLCILILLDEIRKNTAKEKEKPQ
jgi:high-affinity Fe2+/Pb2+ permease